METIWKQGYGKGEVFFSSTALMLSQLLKAIKAFKPCLLAQDFEICISAGGCFYLMSADSLVLWILCWFSNVIQNEREI